MKPAVVCVAVLALSGCASGIDGFYQQVQFDSTPAGAAVTVTVSWLDGTIEEVPTKGSCITPCSLMIGRDYTYRATFTKEGCSSVDLRLYPTRDSTFFVPLLPDAWTGKAHDLKPNPMNAKLRCGAGGA